jgi:hypothetical protein
MASVSAMMLMVLLALLLVLLLLLRRWVRDGLKAMQTVACGRHGQCDWVRFFVIPVTAYTYTAAQLHSNSCRIMQWACTSSQHC